MLIHLQPIQAAVDAALRHLGFETRLEFVEWAAYLSFPLSSGRPTCQAEPGEGSPDGTAPPAVLAGVHG
jgi:hypothetical protein